MSYIFHAPKGKSLPTEIFTATAPNLKYIQIHICAYKSGSLFVQGEIIFVSVATILENIENAASTLLNSRDIRKSIVHVRYF